MQACCRGTCFLQESVGVLCPEQADSTMGLYNARGVTFVGDQGIVKNMWHGMPSFSAQWMWP